MLHLHNSWAWQAADWSFPAHRQYFYPCVMKLHVVSFQVPYPPRYGGLIDVFYKLKALKQAGCHVVLHTYRYAESSMQAESAICQGLDSVADEIYFYERSEGWRSQCSLLPYIVYSRRDRSLLERLCQDDAPILFEGIHTCYFLSDIRLRGRQKWVRMHNVEHNYYYHLARSASSCMQRCYFLLEAIRLRFYEKRLKHASKILAISPVDAGYFQARYPQVQVLSLPCFYNDVPLSSTSLPSLTLPSFVSGYLLYHGNLSVPENRKVACYILHRLLPHLAKEMHLVIAGGNPDEDLRAQADKHSNVTLIANPSPELMDSLLAGARIHLLFTFQATGVKLKLLHALARSSGHCLVNSLMLPQNEFRTVCTVADEPAEQLAAIRQLFPLQPDADTITRRQDFLRRLGYANQVTSILR